jgi:hypothetical protein
MYPEGIAYDKFFREVLWIHIFGAALSQNKAGILIYTRFSRYSRYPWKKDRKQSKIGFPMPDRDHPVSPARALLQELHKKKPIFHVSGLLFPLTGLY